MVAPKTIQDDKNLLSPTEVADLLGVHRSTVHNWLRTGMLKSERHGVFHGVQRAELKRFTSIYTVDTLPKPAKKTKKKAAPRSRKQAKAKRSKKK